MLNMKQLRQENNITLADLVRQSGLSRRTLEDIERRGDCRISTARIICDTLGCTLDEFYTSNTNEGTKD